jgi:hypothetical protein
MTYNLPVQTSLPSVHDDAAHAVDPGEDPAKSQKPN